MPHYDYRCEQCGKFEVYQSIKADPLSECPTCGGPVRRLISGSVNLLFKGSGFHITDYRSEGYKQQAKTEKASSTAEGS
ncbi:MAG: FmdB family zinc ribbon protein [Limnochordia bacterium]|jgi:putative FmdB family regulatory protein